MMGDNVEGSLCHSKRGDTIVDEDKEEAQYVGGMTARIAEDAGEISPGSKEHPSVRGCLGICIVGHPRCTQVGTVATIHSVRSCEHSLDGRGRKEAKIAWKDQIHIVELYPDHAETGRSDQKARHHMRSPIEQIHYHARVRVN